MQWKPFVASEIAQGAGLSTSRRLCVLCICPGRCFECLFGWVGPRTHVRPVDYLCGVRDVRKKCLQRLSVCSPPFVRMSEGRRVSHRTCLWIRYLVVFDIKLTMRATIEGSYHRFGHAISDWPRSLRPLQLHSHCVGQITWNQSQI